MELKPLTTQQIKSKNDVREAYCDFWNNIKFRKGWDTPNFQRREVEHLLDEAAEMVVRIRSYLDKEKPGFKVRMRDGSAREYLWDLEHKQKHPLDEPEEFIREIVHHTFQDANGYVEGLSKEEIDSLIHQIENYKQSTTGEVLSSIKEQWSSTSELMKELLDHQTFQLSPQEGAQTLSKDQQIAFHKLAKDLARINHDVIEILTTTRANMDFESNVETETKEPLVEEPDELPDGTIPIETSEAPVTLEQVQEEPKEVPKEVQNASPMEEIKTEDESNEVKIEEVQEADPPEKGEEMNVDEPKVEEPKDKNDASIVKIQHVAEDVEHIKGEIKSLQDLSSQLEYESLAQDPEGKERVAKLQKKCLEYTEGLMKDLLTLDEIVTSQESRPLRKAQVNAIQTMIEEVESVSKKLKVLAQQLHHEEEERKKKEEEMAKKKQEEQQEENKEEEEEEKEEKEEKEKEDEGEGKETEKEKEKEKETKQKEVPMKRQQVPTRANWSSLKFKPKFEVSETRDAYVLASYIPGMQEDTITIKLSKDNSKITIEGLREPSKQEEHQMRMMIKNRIRNDPYYSFGLDPIGQEVALLMKAGAGRFGKFSETYNLPQGIDTQGIKGTYERGVLKVEIPKVKRRVPKQQPVYGYPAHGRTQNPMSFFGDSDFWW